MTDATPPARMTLSETVRLLLQRGAHSASSVTLSRNAKGETQIEVVVRTADDRESGVATIAEAQAVAQDVYDALRDRYPMLADLPVPAPGDQ